MIDALIGSVIAVIATSALALMLEVMSFSSPESKVLSYYNSKVAERVAIKRGLQSSVELDQKVAQWMSAQANQERQGE
jgi:hypothetical protein